jgi:hypothetical protein
VYHLQQNIYKIISKNLHWRNFLVFSPEDTKKTWEREGTRKNEKRRAPVMIKKSL